MKDGGLAGRGGIADAELVDDEDQTLAGTIAQRTAQRGLNHLLGGPLRVAARLRAVHDAATGPLRRAPRTLTGATGALLAPRLGAAAANLTTRLGGVRALTSRRLLSNHHLVDQRHIRRRIE